MVTSPSLALSLLPPSYIYEDPWNCTGQWKQSPHIKVHNLIVSAKSIFPRKVTSRRSQGFESEHLWGGMFLPITFSSWEQLLISYCNQLVSSPLSLRWHNFEVHIFHWPSEFPSSLDCTELFKLLVASLSFFASLTGISYGLFGSLFSKSSICTHIFVPGSSRETQTKTNDFSSMFQFAVGGGGKVWHYLP